LDLADGDGPAVGAEEDEGGENGALGRGEDGHGAIRIFEDEDGAR
jgi:hypothetical protein